MVSMVTAAVLPVPGGLAADLVESLDHPMRASDGLRELVADPPGGWSAIDDAIKRSLSNGRARPVNELADPHHLADTDPVVGRWRHAPHPASRRGGHAADRPAGARAAQRRTRTRRRSAADRARHPDQPHTEGAPGMTEPTMTEHPTTRPPFLQEVKDNLTRVASPVPRTACGRAATAHRRRRRGGGRRCAAWLFAGPRSRRRRRSTGSRWRWRGCGRSARCCRVRCISDTCGSSAATNAR